MVDLKALLDGLSAQHAEERSESDQWTLSQMIEALEALPPKTPTEGLGTLESYRGYYSDLSFETSGATRSTVETVLADCKSAMGKCFEGYKGGDFWMTGNTPLWDSPYGDATGPKVIGLYVTEGVVHLETRMQRDDEW